MTRSWSDNGNKIPDCDLMNPLAQNNLATGSDSCGAWSLNFGIPFGTTRVNPDMQYGWGVRNNDWQFGVAVQHEILPTVAIDVGYNRRWWNNFFVTDNLALGPQDFDTHVAIDLYNLFNSNTGTAYNQTYDPVTNGATWLAPTTVLNPRFARFNVTVDF